MVKKAATKTFATFGVAAATLAVVSCYMQLLLLLLRRQLLPQLQAQLLPPQLLAPTKQ